MGGGGAASRIRPGFFQGIEKAIFRLHRFRRKKSHLGSLSERAYPRFDRSGINLDGETDR